MASKGGSLLEDVGRLLAPQTTQGFLNAPLERQARAQALDQGSAMNDLAKLLPSLMTGQQPAQTVNIGGQDETIPALKMSTQTVSGPFSNPGALSGVQQLRNDALPTLARAMPTEFAGSMLEKLNPKPIGKLGKDEAYFDAQGNKTASNMVQDIPAEEQLALFVSGGDAAKAKELVNTWKSKMGTTVNVAAGPKAYDQEMGKLNATAYSDIIKAGSQATTKAPQIDRLSNLLNQIDTGAFKGTTTDLKSKAKGLGIDLEAIGITDDTGIAQAAQALSRAQALELRNPAGGAGMPGAMSDADRSFLESMTAGIDKQPIANKEIINAQRKLNRRSQDVASLANKYTREHGGQFDQAGFQEYLQKWADEHPLFEGAKTGGNIGESVKIGGATVTRIK